MSIESQMRFLGQKFFEADGLTQAIFQARFFNSDGNVMPLVGELVDDGFDSIDPLERADNMRLSELKVRCGDKITLMGGITREIGMMMPKESTQHIEQIVKEAGPYGLIVNCGAGVPPEMSLENFMHYSSTIEKFRRL